MKKGFLLCILLSAFLLLSACTPADTPAAVQAPTATEAVATPTPTADPKLALFPAEERVDFYPSGLEWEYASSSVNIHIQRHIDVEKSDSYFVAHVHTNGENLSYSLANYNKRPGYSNRRYTYDIGRIYRQAFVVSGAYFIATENEKGVTIINGNTYSNGKQADTLAFMPDGSLKVFDKGNCDAKSLKDSGVENALSFGPALIRDGKILEDSIKRHPLRSLNPRMGIGMVEPNHYVFILVEGRVKGAKGASLQTYAEMFLKEGCSVAYNLDGGATVSMSFMGQQINRTSLEREDHKKSPDVIMIGYSNLVPSLSMPYQHANLDGSPLKLDPSILKKPPKRGASR